MKKFFKSIWALAQFMILCIFWLAVMGMVICLLEMAAAVNPLLAFILLVGLVALIMSEVLDAAASSIKKFCSAIFSWYFATTIRL